MGSKVTVLVLQNILVKPKSVTWLMMPKSLRCRVLDIHGVDNARYLGAWLTQRRILTTYIISVWRNIEFQYILIFLQRGSKWTRYTDFTLASLRRIDVYVLMHTNVFINPLRAKFFIGNINIYLHFMLLLICHMHLKSFLKYDQDLHILHSQYHGCWCPGDVRSQGISSHDIDLAEQVN